VACGRLHAKQVLWEWRLDALADDAETLVSELLTNAIKASWPLREPGIVALRLLASRHQLIIEAWDQNPHDPQPVHADHESEHGRGFVVIDALSSRWGHRRVSANLKVVWCELVTADQQLSVPLRNQHTPSLGQSPALLRRSESGTSITARSGDGQ
jgi:anti-sigma regulatory factor (Ser/Thr protein kinase)